MELNNPLRGKPLRALPVQDENVQVTSPIEQLSEVQVTAPKPTLRAESTVLPAQKTTQAASQMTTSKQTAMIPHSIEVNSNPELKKAMELLAKHGIETSAPKKNYIKHSYEVEEDLHKEFHDMYPILGFKHVKTAVNDAIRMWCDTNRKEYNRRKGS